MSTQHFMSKDLSLLKSGMFADATITCGDRVWKVHKSIICRCEWFKKAFSGGFEEARTSNVNISAQDFHPDVVDYAISFIYSGVASKIEEIDTNDSVIDACVRLWVIGDFLMFRELEDEAVAILEKYCDEKVRVLSVIGYEGEKLTLTDSELDAVLMQLFRGVETAYTRFPHSLPCQQILISFFHAIRFYTFGVTNFTRLVSKAPHQFSHELLIATIDGRASKWVLRKESEYEFLERKGTCTGCNQTIESYDEPWAVDSRMVEEPRNNRTLNVPWRCIPCFEKHGLAYVCAKDKDV